MFKQSVNATMLTSNDANIFFPNITGDSYGSDCTFLATLRALVAPRLPDGETVRLSFGRSDYTAASVSETPAKRMVEKVCDQMVVEKGRIYVHSLCNREEANNVANIELLKRCFCETYSGWQFLDKISVFYQKSFKVICFVNPELKSTALFVEQLNLQKLHYLQMSTLAFLPWYFDAAHGIEEIELELLKSLRERSSEKYEGYITEISKKYDFEAGRIKRLLTGFETKYEKIECDRVKRDISNVDNQIKDLDRRFAEQIKKRNDLCIRLLGLERRIAEGGQSEIMDYFLCNRRLVLEEVSNTSMSFGVRDYLSYFDEDAARSYIDNDSSYFYRNCGSMSKNGMKKLLTAIFIDQTIKIRFCAAYYFDMNGTVSAQYHHRFGPEFNGYKPNPHIDNFECLGNYKRTINEALNRRDYITALEQSIASAKSLNFHDGVVMDNFVGQFTNNGGSQYKAIELPDGSVVSTREAIKWIEEQEAAAKSTAEPVVESAERVPVVPADVADRVQTGVEAPAEQPAAELPF